MSSSNNKIFINAYTEAAMYILSEFNVGQICISCVLEQGPDNQVYLLDLSMYGISHDAIRRDVSDTLILNAARYPKESLKRRAMECLADIVRGKIKPKTVECKHGKRLADALRGKPLNMLKATMVQVLLDDRWKAYSKACDLIRHGFAKNKAEIMEAEAIYKELDAKISELRGPDNISLEKLLHMKV